MKWWFRWFFDRDTRNPITRAGWKITICDRKIIRQCRFGHSKEYPRSI